MQLQDIIHFNDNKKKPLFIIVSTNKNYLAVKKTGDLLLCSEDFYFDIWNLKKLELLMTIKGSPYRNSQFSYEEIFFCLELMHNRTESIELTNIQDGQQQYIERILSEFRVFFPFCFQFQQKELLIFDINQQEIIYYEKVSQNYQIMDVIAIDKIQYLICSTDSIYLFNLPRQQFQKQMNLKSGIGNNVKNFKSFLLSPLYARFQIYISYKGSRLIRRLQLFQQKYVPIYKWQHIQAFIENNKNENQLNFEILNSLSMQTQSFSIKYNNEGSLNGCQFRLEDIIMTNNSALLLFGKIGEYQIKKIDFNFSE